MSNRITEVTFKGGQTIIDVVSSEQPRDVNTIINDENKKISDLPRHADFIRAMDKMKPHLLIATGLMPAKDCNGNHLQAVHFNDFFADTDDEEERFGNLEITSIKIGGKNAADTVQLFGYKTTPFGSELKLKTDPIPLVNDDNAEYTYELLSILDTQVDKLLLEADLYFQRKKHGAGVQTSLPLPATGKPDPQAKNKLRAVSNQENLVDA